MKKIKILAILCFVLMLASHSRSALSGSAPLFHSQNQTVRVRIFSLHKLKEIKVIGDVGLTTGEKFKKIKITATNHGLKIINLDTLKRKFRGSSIKLKIINHARAGEDLSGYKILSNTLIIKNTGGNLLVINQIPLENYIEGVVASELNRHDLLELNKAQAVVSRSFALTHPGNHKLEGYDFCDSTHCQLYRGINFSPLVSKAINETKGEILTYQDEIIPGYFHSTCGGKTADASEIFQKFIPGIVSIEDKIKGKDFLCKDSEHFNWKATFSRDEISKAFPEISGFKDIKIASFGKSGKAKEIVLIYGHGHGLCGLEIKKITAYNFWLRIGQNFGWGRIKSTYFKIYKKKNKIIFVGHGLGHGLGMCQAGAEKLAKLGYNYKFILKHYFPEAKFL